MRTTPILFALLLVAVPLASAQTQNAGGPVENGGFEGPFVPAEAYKPLEETPVDTCIGLGHQVFFGPTSAAGQATGGQAGNPNPNQADPQEGARAVADDPAAWAEYQSGYGHCVYDPNGRGVDVAWVEPVDRLKQPIMWSVHPGFPSTDFGYTFDDEPFDREARFVPRADGSQLSPHNMWQSYVSQPGVYTANFDALEFDVEAGEIPSSARVAVSLSGTPMDGQSPYVAGYQDCILTFRGDDLAPGPDGTVSTSPLDANLRNDPGDQVKYCEKAVKTFNDPTASEEEKRNALGRLRIVQISFWRFNVDPGEQPVVVDNVAMPGATTVAQELADGNVNVDPRYNPDDV